MGITSRVVIGMDPHKRSATIEVMTSDEQVLGGGRFATGPAGFEAMLTYARQWPDRVRAVEGCEGIGKHLVLRLPGAREAVVDVPAKLSARMAPACLTGVWISGSAGTLDNGRADPPDRYDLRGVPSWPAGLRMTGAGQFLTALIFVTVGAGTGGLMRLPGRAARRKGSAR
jgi:hypothetical protein